MNRIGSPLPIYVVRDSILGHQIPGRDQVVQEFKEKDRASAAELILEVAEIHRVHIEIGTLGWNELPLFGAALSFELRDELLDARQKYIGAAAILKLTWGDVCSLPGYTEGQFSRREAGDQALANYLATQTQADAPLPK
jgi:hypothetical protein